MKPHDLVIGLMSGSLAILLGLVPGLFDDLAEKVRNFHDAVFFGIATPACQHIETERGKRALGLAGFGALVVAFSLIAYIFN